MVLRDPKAKLIIFEMISTTHFSVSQSAFSLPEEVILIIKKYGGYYNFESKEWIVNLTKYKSLAMEIS